MIAATAAALFLAQGFRVGVAAVLVAVLVGLPGLYLLWVTYRDTAHPAAGLADVADQLALAVRSQWEAEARARRINDPYPFAVRWVAAAADLADSWDVIMRLAATGTGRLPRPGAQAWAACQDGLAGGGSELADVLGRVPTGRLVVLGEPGAGKTMLMVRLVLDLLARRQAGGPVPVLVSLASWDPAGPEFWDWLSGQLGLSYSALASPAPPGAGGTCIQALQEAGLILPVLAGLDEITGPARGLALRCINDALRPDQQLVLTCRTGEYRQTAEPLPGAGIVLRAAAAVQLCPLDPGVVAAYLRDDAASITGAARWDPVLACLGTEAPVAKVLMTPLMVGLARTVYSPRPGDSAGVIGDPARLCELPDETAVRNHLLDAFIPAAYRSARTRWPARKAEAWLTFLARHQQQAGDPGIAWWKLPAAVPLAASAIAAVTVAAIAAGAASALDLSLTGAPLRGAFGAGSIGLLIGLLAGLAVVLAAAYRTAPAASRRAIWRLGIRGWISAGLLAAASAAVSVLPSPGLLVFLWLPFAFAAILASGFAVAFRGLPPPSRAGAAAPARASWFIRGLALGAGGGAGATVGLFLAAVIFLFALRFINMQSMTGAILSGLVISSGIAGTVTAGLSIGHRAVPVSPRRTRSLRAVSGLGLGLVLGSVVIAAIGIEIAVVRSWRPEPSRGFRWRPGISNLGVTLVIAAVSFAIADVSGLEAGLGTAITAVLVIGFISGLEGVPRIVSVIL